MLNIAHIALWRYVLEPRVKLKHVLFFKLREIGLANGKSDVLESRFNSVSC